MTRAGRIVGLHHPELGPLSGVKVEPSGFALFTTVDGAEFFADELYNAEPFPCIGGRPGKQIPRLMVLVVELDES